MRLHRLRRSQAAPAFLAYLAFVVYGSLVPFEIRPLAWDQAVLGFRNIEYLSLGLVSRADWIANIVLYVPLAFLGCAALLGMDRGGWRTAPGVALVGTGCLAVAFGVEFAQQWFAPRTVSINDLLAESIGTLLGLTLWGLGRRQLARLGNGIAQGGHASVLAALLAYGIFYLVLSLFPYDFVLSGAELAERMTSENQGWLVAGSCGGPIRCGARLSLDVLAILPLGVLAGLLWPTLGLARLLVIGIAVGLVLEPVQLLLASGTSQGLSVPLRGLGLALGGLVAERLRRLGPAPLARAIAMAAPILILPYLAGLALVSGWLASPAISPAAALERLPAIHWLPLYYHYFTTESQALASSLAQIALYAPLGLLAWALGAGAVPAPVARLVGPIGPGRGAWAAAVLALTLSLVIETGKLFFPPGHPDPTNLAMALAGALAAYALTTWLERVLVGGTRGRPQPRTGREVTPAGPDPATERAHAPALPRDRWAPLTGSGPAPTAADWLRRGLQYLRGSGPAPAAPAPQSGTAPARPLGRSPAVPAPRPLGVALGLLAGLPLVAGTVGFPLAWPLLAVGLALYGLLLWFFPLAWLLVLPALLPALDLSPFTGPLTLDAFDLVVLATLAAGYARLWGQRPLPWPNRTFPLAVALLWVSWILASARGLWPVLGSDWPIPDSSHSPLEAWTVGKGMLWALLLLPLLRRVPAPALEEARARLAQGILLGLALVALSVLWERRVFVGIADFENEFRVTGTFSSMHTGGAYIEAFLAFAFPFLAVAVVRARTPRARGLGLLLAALASYAMMVTFSRGGWAGLAAGILVVLAGALRRPVGRTAWIAAGLLLAAVGATTWPVLTGGFAQGRLGQSLADLKVRVAHWGQAIALMTPGPKSVLVGAGFGQYPLAWLLQPEQRPPGTYAILTEGNNPFLRLGAGESVFLDQRVAIEPGRTYRLALRARLPAGLAGIEIPICGKALLYSFECERVRLAPPAPAAGWQTLAADFQSGGLGAGGHWPHPPVKLSLPNPGGSGALDLDDASLKTQDGQELLANGDFSHGARHWLFVTDQDLAWHIHEQWVELYFAQGLLGVLALLSILAAAGRALWPALTEGEPFAVALAGGLVGILTVGLLGSLVDTAPLAMLLYLALLCPAGTFPGNERRPRRRRSPGHRSHANAQSRTLHPGATELASIADSPTRTIDQ